MQGGSECFAFGGSRGNLFRLSWQKAATKNCIKGGKKEKKHWLASSAEFSVERMRPTLPFWTYAFSILAQDPLTEATTQKIHKALQEAWKQQILTVSGEDGQEWALTSPGVKALEHLLKIKMSLRNTAVHGHAQSTLSDLRGFPTAPELAYQLFLA